ncbi:MAG: Fe-S cluster assembly protein SufD, partial [Bacteroidota bacterium]
MDVNNVLKSAYTELEGSSKHLSLFQQENWKTFSGLGIPALKHEEWRYVPVKNMFKDELQFSVEDTSLDTSLIQQSLLPGTEDFNYIVFYNGRFQETLSIIKEKDVLIIKSLETAAGDEDAEFVENNLGHSHGYHPDGVNALNGAFAAGGAFIKVKKGTVLRQPLIIYHFADSRKGYRFAQPRILVSAEANAQSTIVETYINIGDGESLTNEVLEICTGRDSVTRYIKLQNEGKLSNYTGTTHVRQLERSNTHAVTITLDGGVVRNNLNMVMEDEHAESHMYGLYLLKGNTLADNHTIVDNKMPHCESNELYKGIMYGQSTGVFNGKIFVRKDAQKTNAYQSNKNILIGDQASANTKPQLEIFADDVKCSHGCTIGKLDEDALFYLRARGIAEKNAKALLLHAFASDILGQIENEAIRIHVEQLIAERLSF